MEAKQYFKDHPTRIEVFQTSDGFMFHLETDAKNHARSLKDKIVKKITNPAASVEKAEQVTEVVETIIGADEAGNIVNKAVTTQEITKVKTEAEEGEEEINAIVDKAVDVPVVDASKKEVVATPEDTKKAEVKTTAKSPAKKTTAKK